MACTAAIQEATTALKAAVNSPNCCGNIQTQFKLCSPLSNSNSLDVASLFEYLAGNFAGIIQYNGFYSLDLNDLCNTMTNTALGDPLARYAAVNDLLLNLYGASCTDFTYASWIDYLSETSWDSPSAQDGCKQHNIDTSKNILYFNLIYCLIDRQWFYQTCTEFGYYQSSDSNEQPFSDQFPIDFIVGDCAAAYGPQFNAAAVQAAVDRTNSAYGGLGIELTRTVFPNGSIDPWHALGVTNNATGNVAIYIDGETHTHIIIINILNNRWINFYFYSGTSHCADMYPPSASDSAQLIAARQKIEANLDAWLLG